MRRWVFLVACASVLGLFALQPGAAAQKGTAVRQFPSLEALEKEEMRLRKDGKEVRRIKIANPQLMQEQPDICRSRIGEGWRTVGCFGPICLCFNNPFD